MAANQRARPKPKRRAESKRPVRRQGSRREDVVPSVPCHHCQASSAISDDYATITEGDIAIIYGDESQPRARIFPLLAAERVDDDGLWRPSRLR